MAEFRRTPAAANSLGLQVKEWFFVVETRAGISAGWRVTDLRQSALSASSANAKAGNRPDTKKPGRSLGPAFFSSK
jgi:hypothetical protein